MDETKENKDDALSYHYKEMVRISNIIDSHIKGVFGDFKLLTAVGGILSWKPIHDAFELGGPNDTKLLFLGFVAMILFLSIVGIMNLQRQLILNFSLEQVQYYESEIRSLLCCKDSLTFRAAENWRTFGFRKQILVSLIFNIHFYVVAVAPSFILKFDEYGGKYLAIAVTVIAINIVAMIIVYRKSKLPRNINP